MRRAHIFLAACALVAVTAVATAGAATTPRKNIVQIGRASCRERV